MKTNLGKTKEEIIYEILLSLNNGSSGYIDVRVKYAIQQYEQLVEQQIIKEDKIIKEDRLNDEDFVIIHDDFSTYSR